jgi:hypothetical protein
MCQFRLLSIKLFNKAIGLNDFDTIFGTQLSLGIRPPSHDFGGQSLENEGTFYS